MWTETRFSAGLRVCAARLILDALERSAGNRTRAAEDLGMGLSTLQTYIARLDIGHVVVERWGEQRGGARRKK